MSSRLQTIDDRTWADFRDAPAAVLVLAREDCPHCRAWSDELADFLEQDTEWTHVRFGKVFLDGDDIDVFQQENGDWLDIVPGVPFNAIFRDGQPLTSMAGGGVKRLVRRLQRRLSDTNESD